MKMLKQALVCLITATAMASAGESAKGGAGGKASGAKVKPYPLETCVVRGEKLGGMGEPHVFVHEGQEIKLCCKGCLKEFNKDTSKYMAKIEDAARKLKPYTLKTCIVTGETLDDNAYRFASKGREIKLCCKGCLKEFNREPDKFIKKIEEAEKAARK